MKLRNYHFGRIEVDGVLHTEDLLVAPREVREWRRREGHVVHPEDLEGALAFSPELLVVGTGFSGLLRVTKEAERHLAQCKVELITARTGEAVEAYNDLSHAKTVCALLHLTC